MKVLHVCESVLGGTGAHLNELIPALQQALGKQNVTLLGPAEHFSQIPDIDPQTVLTYRRPDRKAGLPQLVIAFIKAMFRFRPDLVHAHSTFAGVITRLICPLFGVPVVYCPHGWAMEMEQSPARRRFIGWVERNLAPLSTTIIAVSEHERSRGIAAGIALEKMTAIYNGIRSEPPAFTPSVWNDDRLKVLYVGRFDRQKGIDVLLDAIKPLQDELSVRVIGGSVVGKSGIDFTAYPHVQTLGWVDAPTVAAHMAACDVVVMPSRWEGLPITAVEAMRLSKPLIAASVGGIPELVSDGENGYLFASGDVTALRHLLSTVDKAELERRGRAGRQKFLDLFTVDRMFTEVLEVYQAIDNKKKTA